MRTQLMIIKGTNAINELMIRNVKLEFPVKTLSVYWLANTVKLFGDCSKIAQKKITMNEKKVTAISLSLVTLEYCVNL